MSRRVVLFGGMSGDRTNPEPRSFWSWDGAQWRCLSDTGPSGRDSPELAFDAARRRLVLYGGRTRGADGQMRVLTDTWEWDGSQWTLRDSAGAPPRRIHMTLGFDVARGAVLLHGGLNTEARGQLLTDTWRWSGARWEPVSLSPDSSGMSGPGALAMVGKDVLLVVGVVDSAACPPNGRWERQRARVLMLRGSTWARRGPDGPCFGSGGVTATSDGLMLVADSPPGSPWPSEAWGWRNDAWNRLGSAPTNRRAARIAYDPVRTRVVLFGGDDANGMLGDTWEWDGKRWTQHMAR